MSNNGSGLALAGSAALTKAALLTSSTAAGSIATSTGGIGLTAVTAGGTTVTAMAIAPAAIVGAAVIATGGLIWYLAAKSSH